MKEWKNERMKEWKNERKNERKKMKEIKTRPDTWHSSRGRLGRSSNAKTAWNSKTLRRDRPTGRHGKVSSHVSATKKVEATSLLAWRFLRLNPDLTLIRLIHTHPSDLKKHVECIRDLPIASKSVGPHRLKIRVTRPHSFLVPLCASKFTHSQRHFVSFNGQETWYMYPRYLELGDIDAMSTRKRMPCFLRNHKF